MATEIRVPALGESVTEATVGKWFKQAGDAVAADEPLVELETDKVTLEVPAPAAGVLSEIVVKAGDTVAVGTVLGAIQAGDGKAAAPAAKAPEPAKEFQSPPRPRPRQRRRQPKRRSRPRSRLRSSASRCRARSLAPMTMTRCRRRPRHASCWPRRGSGSRASTAPGGGARC